MILRDLDFKVYNMTLIGAGALSTNINGGADSGVTLRPWAGPKIYNAIFTDFNAEGVRLDTQQGITATQSVLNAYAQFHNTLWWNFATGSGSGVIDNSIANLSRNTVASNYWTDASLTNQITDPLLTSISRTNVGAFLDPRPKAGSPAYSNYATPNDGFLTSANYRGAFGSGRNSWISDWTALSEYGIVGGAGGFNPQRVQSAATVPTPNPVTLTLTFGGANLEIVYPSQSGYSYQFQSATNFGSSTFWTDEGEPQTGTGGMLTNTVPTTEAEKYFRVKTQ